MADAVEKAAVVVVCMTRKYKQSLNCRSGKFDCVHYEQDWCFFKRSDEADKQ